MIVINYALQVCDMFSNQCSDRYCSNSKTEVTIKCVTSFFLSVEYASKQKQEASHRIKVFVDKSSEEVIDFLHRAKERFTSDNLFIDIVHTDSSGIMKSIRRCWEWLKNEEGSLIYQVQDDYLFTEDAIYQMISMFMQVYNDVGAHTIINPYNDALNWYCDGYRYKQTPRVFIPGLKQYWIQCYDISCSFMTSREQFNRHWDMYEKFLSLDPKHGDNGNLENITLNRILVDRNVIGLMPVESVSLHMQSELEKDPYIDWEKRWNSVPVI